MSDWTDDSIRARFANLSTWRNAGVRAPHKPLLVLHVLGRVLARAERLVRFAEVEAPVNGLITDFGPPRSQASAHYPFWHLHSDGIWEIPEREAILAGQMTRGNAPRMAALRQARGGFPAALHTRLVAQPWLVIELVESLIAGHFPSSYREDIRDRIGVPAGLFQAQVLARQVERAYRFALGRPRDPAFRRSMLEVWKGCCAICGFGVQYDGRPFGVEAAHIKWHAAGGPDTPDNGMLMCVLHHRAFDRGLIGLEADRTIKMSPSIGPGVHRDRWFGRYHGRPLLGPDTGPPPDGAYIEWHDRQVFRAA